MPYATHLYSHTHTHYTHINILINFLCSIPVLTHTHTHYTHTKILTDFLCSTPVAGMKSAALKDLILGPPGSQAALSLSRCASLPH